MDYNKLVEVVNVLEQEVYDKTKGVKYLNFEVTTNGFATMVHFIGLCIWNSQADDREYCEKTDSYEPMEKHLRRVLNEELENIKGLKF